MCKQAFTCRRKIDIEWKKALSEWNVILTSSHLAPFGVGNVQFGVGYVLAFLSWAFIIDFFCFFFIRIKKSIDKVKKFSLNGELLCEYQIKAKEYQSIYQTFLEKNKSEKRQSAYWPLYYVNDLALDKRGNLYILLNKPSIMTIYVYDHKGRLIGRLAHHSIIHYMP